MRKHYRNCDELPIFNFYKVMETNDYAWLYSEPLTLWVKISSFFKRLFRIESLEKIENELSSLWENIYNEYLKLIGDTTSEFYYELLNEVLYLETRHRVVLEILKQLSKETTSIKYRSLYIKELRSWKYKINTSKPLGEELDRMIRQLRASENTIRIKTHELQQLKDTGNVNEKTTLIEQIVSLEDALSKNHIDEKTTVVSKWVAMIKKVEINNNLIRKRNGK